MSLLVSLLMLTPDLSVLTEKDSRLEMQASCPDKQVRIVNDDPDNIIYECKE